jgi:isocitrate/isopropylmalate dehydrogenase
MQAPAGRVAVVASCEYQVDLIPGDGIGHEVYPKGVKVIAAVGELLGGFRIA